MNAIKKSWRDVTIDEYFELVDIMSEDCEEYTKEVRAIAFLNGMDENEVWNLSVPEFNRLQEEKAWINKFDINKNAVFKSIKIGETKCDIDININKFTVAQYIDFQTFWPHRDEMEKYIGNILACFIIPHGMKYNDGYDIDELAKMIRSNVDIMTAQEILFFFLSSYQISIRITLNYLNLKMRRMKRRSKDPEIKEKLEEARKQIASLERLISDGFIS